MEALTKTLGRVDPGGGGESSTEQSAQGCAPGAPGSCPGCSQRSPCQSQHLPPTAAAASMLHPLLLAWLCLAGWPGASRSCQLPSEGPTASVSWLFPARAPPSLALASLLGAFKSSRGALPEADGRRYPETENVHRKPLRFRPRVAQCGSSLLGPDLPLRCSLLPSGPQGGHGLFRWALPASSEATAAALRPLCPSPVEPETAALLSHRARLTVRPE